MAAAHPLPAPTGGPPDPPEAILPAAVSLERELIPAAPKAEEEALIAPTPPLVRLPVELDVSVAVKEFRVRNLLALESGQVIETQWGHGADVPLAAGDVQLAWSEFEVVDAQLAIRLTRLV
jgi:flagellar motor switch/type III secretory pathway protein FliN